MSRRKEKCSVIPIARAKALRDTRVLSVSAQAMAGVAEVASKEFRMNIAPAIRSVLDARSISKAEQEELLRVLESVYVVEQTKRHLRKQAT